MRGDARVDTMLLFTIMPPAGLGAEIIFEIISKMATLRVIKIGEITAPP